MAYHADQPVKSVQGTYDLAFMMAEKSVALWLGLGL
jgi:hypothetical protein